MSRYVMSRHLTSCHVMRPGLLTGAAAPGHQAIPTIRAQNDTGGLLPHMPQPSSHPAHVPYGPTSESYCSSSLLLHLCRCCVILRVVGLVAQQLSQGRHYDLDYLPHGSRHEGQVQAICCHKGDELEGGDGADGTVVPAQTCKLLKELVGVQGGLQPDGEVQVLAGVSAVKVVHSTWRHDDALSWACRDILAIHECAKSP
mmetsp:Transcript_27127/g.59248  ORF Transcript_27127/g.59248 Transcript_27127/m.59248 type:complete len:200 (+) Transcript_27127:1266-1865(+)